MTEKEKERKRSYHYTRAEKWKSEHRCRECGAKLPEDYTKLTCAVCLDIRKVRREAAKAAGKCLRCGKEDAYTMNKHTYCADCTAWYCERGTKWAKANRQAINERTRARAAERKQNGECIVCGVKLADNSVYAMCEKCRQKHKAYRRKAYEAEGHISRTQAEYMGLCKRCCREPAMDGKKLCERCYSDFMKANAIATELNKKRHDEARTRRIARERGEKSER